MSSIPQNHSDEKALIDCVQRFFSKHHVGKLLARCNGMKEKGVSPVSLLSYKLSNIFCRKKYVYAATDRLFLRKRFPRTRSTVSLIPQKQTGSVYFSSCCRYRKSRTSKV